MEKNARFEMELLEAERVRREMDLNESAARTRDAINDSEDVVDLKPNFFGIGVNLNSVWRRFMAWFKSR